MSTREPVFNAPAVVIGTIALFAVVHVAQSFMDGQAERDFFLSLAFIPARYASNAYDIPGGGLAGLTSFFTYMLLHGDYVHLGLNSLWMLAFGSAVAKRAGTLRFLLFSAVCGVAGALTHLAAHWGSPVPMVGASAAISGQMAAALRFIFSVRTRRDHEALRNNPRAVPLAGLAETLATPAVLLILASWVAINVVFGMGGISFGAGDNTIAWEAHLGGFAAGLFLYSFFDPPESETGIQKFEI